MMKYFTLAASMATVVTIGFTAYFFGQNSTANSAKETKIHIINSINNSISDLSQDKVNIKEDFIIPLKALVSAAAQQSATDKNTETLENAKKEVRDALKIISLASYNADSSPFIPPVNKVQLLCLNNFSFTYTGQYNSADTRAAIKINTGHAAWFKPGDMRKFTNNGSKLTITYMEYRKSLKSPVIRYECIS